MGLNQYAGDRSPCIVSPCTHRVYSMVPRGGQAEVRMSGPDLVIKRIQVQKVSDSSQYLYRVNTCMKGCGSITALGAHLPLVLHCVRPLTTSTTLCSPTHH
jgi:hypothetical protein